MKGFHTVTICAICEPPVVAISTGQGSRCPRCDQMDDRADLPQTALPDGALARQILRDIAVRSDPDSRRLAELARRLLDHVGKITVIEDHIKDLEKELTELRDLANLVADADISALPPELLRVRQRWIAEAHTKEVTEAASCPFCTAGEPSVWDDVLFHYAHPHGEGTHLKYCWNPWRARCLRCSADPGACICAVFPPSHEIQS